MPRTTIEKVKAMNGTYSMGDHMDLRTTTRKVRLFHTAVHQSICHRLICTYCFANILFQPSNCIGSIKYTRALRTLCFEPPNKTLTGRRPTRRSPWSSTQTGTIYSFIINFGRRSYCEGWESNDGETEVERSDTSRSRIGHDCDKIAENIGYLFRLSSGESTQTTS